MISNYVALSSNLKRNCTQYIDLIGYPVAILLAQGYKSNRSDPWVGL